MLHAAIVGLGWWGKTLVESVQSTSEQIHFIKGATLDADSALEFAFRHGLELVEDFGDVLSDPRVQAVVLATPHSLHCAQIMAAAGAGKHVFSEKPLALTLADALTAVDACGKAGIVLAVGHDRRLLPGILELKRLVDAGALGEIVHMEAQYSNDAMSRGLSGEWRSKESEAPGGGMTGPGLHALDTLLYLGPKLRRVSGRLSQFKPFPNPIDSVGLLLEFEGGATGLLGTVRGVPDFIRIHVFGTLGWAELRDFKHLSVRLLGAEPTHQQFNPKLNAAIMLELFAKAAGGGEPFPLSAQSMLETVAAFEASVNSLRLGQNVVVSPVSGR